MAAKPAKMPMPKVLFGSPLPAQIAKIVGKSWEAMTLPNPDTWSSTIYFKAASKKKVSEALACHEMQHAEQVYEYGGGLYYAAVAMSYALQGYDKSIVEQDANKRAKVGFTPEQAKWWAAL
jgi:hypothetical protein